MRQALFALLCAGLYERNFAKFPALTLQQWKALVVMARRQTVTGLLYRGVTHLPKDYPLPEEILLELSAEADRLERQSLKMNQVAEKLIARFEAEGLHPIIMKGPESARFYPHPLLRECGDLDLYFPPSEIDRVIELAGTVQKAPDGTFHFKEDGVDIDVHQDYFKIHSRHLPAVPSPEATLLMLSAHVLQHAMGPGIGLRQLCDVAMAYKALLAAPSQQAIAPTHLQETPGSGTSGEKAPVISSVRLRTVFRDAGLERWNRLLFSFLHKHLGAAPLYEELPSPEPLEKIVLEGGNFGHFSASRRAAISKGAFRRKLDTAGRYLRRLPFSLKYAPREFLPSVARLLSGNLRKH